MNKKDKPIKDSVKAANNATHLDPKIHWQEEYRDLFSMKMKPVNENFIERLSQDLVNWARTDEALIHASFYNSKGIARSQYYRWVDKFPLLAQAHELSLELIGERREAKYMGEAMVRPMMAFYSGDHKGLETWRNKNKIEQVTADKRPIILGALQGVEVEKEGE